MDLPGKEPRLLRVLTRPFERLGSPSAPRMIGFRLRPATYLEEVTDPRFAWKADGEIEHWDGSASRVYGHTKRQAVGQHVGELLQADWPMSFEALVATLQREGRWRGEVRHRARDGRVLIVESRIRRFGEGKHELFVECTRDIADRDAIAARFDQILLNVADEVVSYDRLWRYTYVNNVAARRLDKPCEELIGRCVWDIFPEMVDSSYYVSVHNAAAEQREMRVERPVADQDKWVEEHIYPSVEGVSVISIDITDRKKYERIQLEKQQRLYESIAVAAHEIRGALAPVRSSIGVLDSLCAGSSVMKLPIQISARQTMQISRLVDDLVDSSNINLGKIALRLAPHNLTELVAASVEDARNLTEGCGLALNFVRSPEPVTANIDATRIDQVMRNLLTNACKYTDPGGIISIRTHSSEHEAIIEVQDTGIGIPAGSLDSIFELFNQVPEHRLRSHGGLGIGLALVRAIVQSHGGTITSYSAGPGMGSRFSVRFPLMDATSQIASERAEDVRADSSTPRAKD